MEIPKVIDKKETEKFTWRDYATMGAVSKSYDLGIQKINPQDLMEDKIEPIKEASMDIADK